MITSIKYERSKITKQQIVNEQDTVDNEAFLLLPTIGRKADTVFVIFWCVFVEAMKEVLYLSHPLLFEHFRALLESRVGTFIEGDLVYVISYAVETPPR
jgi:hypothetical protein